MKRKIFLLILALVTVVTSCKKDLDIPPPNILQDPDVFGNTAGVEAYMARIYSELPIEDFKWLPNAGFKSFWRSSPFTITGEAISRDATQQQTETFNYWADAYSLIRECNYFMETLPSYASNYNTTQVNSWLGEAKFIRAMTYFALVKRYGGVPLVDKVLTKPGETIDDIVAEIDKFKIPRSSEQAIWDFIASDLDDAFTKLPDISGTKKGRVTKWAALAFKSRIMLYAGSIAKYNTINLTVGGVQLCGIPSAKAVDYFKASYDAAAQVIGKYSLYKQSWSATDKAAQANNFAALFIDQSSSENIFVRQYHYPEAAHWYDVEMIPRQLWNGVESQETCPTLDFIEMFEGLPKNANGTFQTLDGAGHYIMYNNPGDPFANAEPRLRGTVLFPGDLFKNQIIDIRRGIYTGASAGGINKLLPAGSKSPYPTTNIVQAPDANQADYTLPDGSKMKPGGLSGYFVGTSSSGSISGFSIRKWLDPNKPTTDLATNRSDQAWIEMRYAEVLLNQAEAAYELFTAGQGAAYQTTALTNINLIRERAGATQATLADMTSVDIIRKERRKELAYENKTWWDLKRWRIIDKEQNATVWRVLWGFYSSQAKQYFYDDRFDERNTTYTFDPKWYYEAIPTAVISKSPNVVPNLSN
ncbi:RagB/SusD family nutrient uptake outer membrane protein [Mucilaginibacter boryungensis]|uniref:RagB/SusD family nutrient uptake outer membrane protein n=1 Tax=Mucilaginibacter boryungensis TaxID=768480 RepID=A0ABR9XJM4_9SPHI|nr:RagB/SusD family nutrient uptake outer membrane protein [Mucilaginibacter boryungensis]MBE9667577.1 RagB/SusD family nutrient uptake outer membrane protein [Mucilaginibacter boryungensis]